jgi:hypothetical protein
MGALCSLLHGSEIIAIRGAFIEGHDNVGSQRLLKMDTKLWGEEVLATIDVGPEKHPLIAYPAKMSQAEYLITAAISDCGAMPTHKAMESPQPFDNLDARPEIEVIGIAQNYRGTQRNELLGGEGLNCCLGAHRDESWGRHCAMGSGEYTGACPSVGAGFCYLKAQSFSPERRSAMITR